MRAALAALPSVSIVTDATNLFDSATGIYVNPGNRGLAWERPCSIELLNDPEGGFQVNAGLRIRGGYSRTQDNPKHAWRLFFRGEYGAATLDYPLFGRAGASSFNQIDLRTAQNYSWSFGGDARNSFLREEFARQAFVEMGWPGSHVKYVQVYLNGQYWGLFDFDERTEADHCAEYLGGDKPDWDVVKAEQDSGYITGPTDGNLDAWTNLFARANPLVAPGTYTRRTLTEAEYFDLQGLAPDGVTTNASPVLLDVDALIDYMLLTFWTGNTDGATSAFLGDDRANNWFGARDRTSRRGFVYFPHDFEHCLFDITGDRTGPFNRTFSNASTYEEKRLYYNPMFLHADLMDVPAYRMHWRERVQRHLFNGGMLDLAANRARIQRLAAMVDGAIIAESARWGDTDASPPRTRADWMAERDFILDSFLPARTARIIAQLRADGLYPGLDGVLVHPPGGFIRSTTPLHLSGPDAGGVTWYYTTHGGDPLLPDGSPSPAAQVYTPAGVVTNTLVTSGESAPGATWRYRDPSADLGSSAIVEGHASYSAANWKHPAFDDSAAVWKTGDAELGAGDTGEGRPERTVINIGPAGARYPAVYFRRKFVVEDPARYESLMLDALIDDGAIFYLNGREAGRVNMPAGAVGYAYSGLNASNESTFQPVTSATLLPSLLVAGTNQFAVEVHNASAGSSDLSFDVRLRATRTVFSSPVLLPPGEVTVRARAFDGAAWSALSEVTFLVDAEAPSATNLVVSEIHYHPDVLPSEILQGYNDDTFFEFLELQNVGPQAVDLMGLHFTRGLTWTFDGAGPLPRLLAPGGRAVVAGHQAAYESRHGTGTPLAGVFSGQLDNGGETLTLVDAGGAVIRDFAYDDAPPWPVEPDGGGASLVLVRPESLPDHSRASNWRASVAGAHPGASDTLDYAAWKQAFAPGQGDFDDADADGIPLLFEYAHGGDPGRADAGLAPHIRMQGLPGEPLFCFDMRAGADDVEAIPETSTDLAAWSSATLSLQSRERIPGGLDRLTYRLLPPQSAQPLLYLRVRAEAP
ncbi:MAG: CotH kinase family protein [Kiritimatiellia bacterium]